MGLFKKLRTLFDRWSKEEKSVDDAKRTDGNPEQTPARPAHSKPRKAEPPRYLVVGLDWGTSCTKVVIRDPYGPDSPAYLVNFGKLGDEELRHLLPTCLFLSHNGEASLREEHGWRSLTRLKLNLMEGKGSVSYGRFSACPKEIAALYLGLVLRYAREWFIRTHEDIYGTYEIEWQLNLGIPAASHDDVETCNTFREVALVGWQLSQHVTVTLEKAHDAFQEVSDGTFDAGIADYNVNVVPEVAAQVVGYAQSNLRRKGLHLLIDVGAATLDVAGFILTERDGEDRYNILRAQVEPLGTTSLEQERWGALKKLASKVFSSRRAMDTWARKVTAARQNPMHKVHSDLREYFPCHVRSRISLGQQRSIEEDFQADCFKVLREVIADLRGNRDPNAPMWNQGLPIFLAGGGRSIKVYNRALANLNAWRDRHLRAHAFKVRSLPMPASLQSKYLRPEDAHRFSVAYGLSYPIDDIGVVKPPHRIADLDLKVYRRRRYTYEDTKEWT